MDINELASMLSDEIDETGKTRWSAKDVKEFFLSQGFDLPLYEILDIWEACPNSVCAYALIDGDAIMASTDPNNSVGDCTYSVLVQLEDIPIILEDVSITDELLINAPCGLDETDLYDYVFDAIKDKLVLLATSNDQEEYRLTNEEIDFFDSAWGFHGGVPEEEYDEELAEEGYYDSYYDEPQYSGYMTNLTWQIIFKYNDIQFTVEIEDDVWKNEDEVVDYAKECIADGFDIIGVDVIG